jgi:hypothetical protein
MKAADIDEHQGSTRVRWLTRRGKTRRADEKYHDYEWLTLTARSGTHGPGGPDAVTGGEVGDVNGNDYFSVLATIGEELT